MQLTDNRRHNSGNRESRRLANLNRAIYRARRERDINHAEELILITRRRVDYAEKEGAA